VTSAKKVRNTTTCAATAARPALPGPPRATPPPIRLHPPEILQPIFHKYMGILSQLLMTALGVFMDALPETGPYRETI